MKSNHSDTKFIDWQQLQLQKQAVLDLVQRRFPEHRDQFEFELIPPADEHDVFEIRNAQNQILIQGSNGITLASALNWYLKYTCQVHFSWCGNQLKLPARLPRVKETVHHVSQHRYRYYLNYCTFSYSMPWWDWARWEQEIDWMALNGINLPLAALGQEIVWQRVYQDLGFSPAEIAHFFAGPAYRAWGLMGNIENWGGPLSPRWIGRQQILSTRILERERAFGMMPVLPGFAGNVPGLLKIRFPKARIQQLPGWYGYPGCYFLAPQDPLYAVICQKFMTYQQALYGTQHFYATDIFHEIEALSEQSEFLAETAREVLNGMLTVDPDAIWVLQSWSLRESSLKKLPHEHVLILDLFGESEPKWQKMHAFGGKPWIWCVLHNFGGRSGLSGNLAHTLNSLAELRQHPTQGNLTGLGFAPEGIEQNPVVYDLLTEMTWREQPPELNAWIQKYSRRRYGQECSRMVQAWQLLLATVYSGPAAYGPIESIICARPGFEIKKVSSNGSTTLYYDPHKLFDVWQLFLACGEILKPTATFRYDLVDIGRQVLANFAQSIYRKIVAAYQQQDRARFEKYGQLLLELILDLDALLTGDEHFSFANWVAAAKSHSPEPEEQALLQWNARTQVTLWSSPEIPEFHDYANKQWSGLIRDFYYRRWEMFLTCVQATIGSGQFFDSAAFLRDLLAWEKNWAFQSMPEDRQPVPDFLEMSQFLFNKYSILKTTGEWET